MLKRFGRSDSALDDYEVVARQRRDVDAEQPERCFGIERDDRIAANLRRSRHDGREVRESEIVQIDDVDAAAA